MLPWARCLPCTRLAMIPTITIRELFAIFLVLFCASCQKKPWRVWNCFEENGSCRCMLFDARVETESALCTHKYECCVFSSQSMDSETRTMCDCWNPSQGGATCESQLPPPGQESELWKRVDRCKK